MKAATTPRRISWDAERFWFDKIQQARDPVCFGQFLRYKSLTDVVFLARVLLHYDLIDDPWHYFIAHRQEHRRKPLWACIGPRQTYKSVLLNTSKSIQRILRNPDVTILQVGADEGVAGGRLAEIMGHFAENRLFRAVWGDWVGSPWSLSKGQMSVSRRRQSTTDPTMGIGTPEKESTSKHPQMIMIDDLEAKTNAFSEVEREKVKAYFNSFFGLLRHDGLLDVANTPWHFKALIFDELLNEKTKRYKDFDFVVMPIQTEGGEFLMPKVFNKEYLEYLTRQWGFVDVSCQMYLWPIGTEDARFDMSLLETNTARELPELLTKWLFWDPTKSAEGGHDPNGVAVLGMDAGGCLYVLDAREITATPLATGREVLDVVQAYDVTDVAIEAAPGVTQYRELLEDIMFEPGYSGPRPRLHTVKADQRKKEHRIYGMMQMWERNRLQIHAGMYPPHKIGWVRQMQSYPVGHDDLLDCAAYFQDCPRFRPPRAKKKLSKEMQEKVHHVKMTKQMIEDLYADKRGRQAMGIVGGLPDFM